MKSRTLSPSYAACNGIMFPLCGRPACTLLSCAGGPPARRKLQIDPLPRSYNRLCESPWAPSFASSQVPVAERDVWNPPFLKLMASLLITREDQLFQRQVANEVLAELCKTHPEQDFKFESADKIRGRDRTVYLGNVIREVRASPEQRERIITKFVEQLFELQTEGLGQEVWEEIQG